MWGKDDQIGNMNYVSKEKVLESLSIPRRGRVYSLSHMLDERIPLNPFHGPFFYQVYRRLEDGIRFWGGNFSAMNLRLEMTDQHGTHVDSLNHVSVGYSLYNTPDGREITTEKGTVRLGIETMPPLVTRGLLVDVAGRRGTDILPADHKIGLEEVKKTISLTGIKGPRKGDVVLFRTGYSNLWAKDNQRFIGPPLPGITSDVADWLTSSGVAAAGSDTQSLEYISATDPPTGHVEVVHQKLIVENGIHIVENLTLEELSRDEVYEFLFVCLPLKIKGASGSPLNPVAIS